MMMLTSDKIDFICLLIKLFSSHKFSLSLPSRQKFNDGKFPHLIPPNPAIRALLVFSKDDQASDAMIKACERLNIDVCRAKSVDTALDTFQHPVNGGHHLVIVDGRCKNIDVESLGR